MSLSRHLIPVNILWGILDKAGIRTMNLVKRAFFRKSVLSILITVAIIMLLVLISPSAKAVTVTVSNISSSSPGSPVSFTVTVNVENTDLLPIYRVNLGIINQDQPGTYTRTCTDLPRLASIKNYPDAVNGNVSITATTASGWGGASDSNRIGYGYRYPSGPPNYQVTGDGYGYGYVGGGSTSITYNVIWSTPSSWPTGIYEIEVLVYVSNGGTPLSHPQTYTFTLSTGGGTPGGGGAPEGVTMVYSYINPEGKFIQDVTAVSYDKKVSLLIKQGVIAKTWIGAPLSWVSIKLLEDPPEPPEDLSIIGIPYDLKPDMATFDPPIRITFKYNPADIPEGISEEDLSLAYYDSTEARWVKLVNIIVDMDNNTISGDLSHFTAFAVIPLPDTPETEVTPEPEPTTETETEPIPTPPTTTEPVPESMPTPEPTPESETEQEVESETVTPMVAPFQIEESGGINQWVLAGIVFGCAVLIIAVAVYLFWYKKILE
jgi:hypothetical protein